MIYAVKGGGVGGGTRTRIMWGAAAAERNIISRKCLMLGPCRMSGCRRSYTHLRYGIIRGRPRALDHPLGAHAGPRFSFVRLDPPVIVVFAA